MTDRCPHCLRPYRAKLTADQVREIEAAPVGQVRALARKYKVDRRTIQRRRARAKSVDKLK